jgi:hypothetical protein
MQDLLAQEHFSVGSKYIEEIMAQNKVLIVDEELLDNVWVAIERQAQEVFKAFEYYIGFFAFYMAGVMKAQDVFLRRNENPPEVLIRFWCG